VAEDPEGNVCAKEHFRVGVTGICRMLLDRT
jgi:hypothetical protein